MSLHTASLAVAVVAVLMMTFITTNPFLFGFATISNGDAQERFLVPARHVNVLDSELEKFRPDLGDDYEAYRNHCLRVLTFTKYFLTEQQQQDDDDDDDQLLQIAATAIAYHDIALWSHHALDYLDPSADVMEQRQSHIPNNKQQQVDVARIIILQHHKLTSYHHNSKNASLSEADIALVNAVRKADWSDFSLGVIRFGLPSSLLEAAYAAHPEAGFHRILMGMGSRLSPDSLTGQLAVLNIFKW